MRRYALSVGLASMVLAGGIAQAACTNSYYPNAFRYTQMNADGSRLVQVHEFDNDNLDARRLLVYRGGTLIASSPSGYLSLTMPPGAGTWYYYAADVDKCGTIRQYIPVATYSN